MKYMFVAKANCYNLGFNLANYIEDIVDYFVVFSLDEGINLRRLNIFKPILVLCSNILEIEDYIKYDLDVTFCTLYDLSVAESVCKSYNQKLKVHIPIDTGMNRFGIKGINSFSAILKYISGCSYLDFYAIYTHFTMPINVQILKQCHLFNDYIKLCNNYGFNPVIHCISSSYVDNSLLSTINSDYVRIGIGNYTKSIKSTMDCVEIYSKIITIKDVNCGETVGYNTDFITEKDTKIAVALGGYNDGISKNFVGYKVKIGKSYCKIIAVCMDIFFVDITSCNVKNNDIVQILSVDDNKISLDILSKHSKLSKYEILTGFNGRIETIYKNK